MPKKSANKMPIDRTPMGLHRMPGGRMMKDSDMPMGGKKKTPNKSSKKKGR